MAPTKKESLYLTIEERADIFDMAAASTAAPVGISPTPGNDINIKRIRKRGPGGGGGGYLGRGRKVRNKNEKVADKGQE